MGLAQHLVLVLETTPRYLNRWQIRWAWQWSCTLNTEQRTARNSLGLHCWIVCSQDCNWKNDGKPQWMRQLYNNCLTLHVYVGPSNQILLIPLCVVEIQLLLYHTSIMYTCESVLGSWSFGCRKRKCSRPATTIPQRCDRSSKGCHQTN